jgi:hypothetical protein
MIAGIERIGQNAQRAIADMTDELGSELYFRYIENLEGSVPSTESSPLPVGIRSGDLIGNAQYVKINQYAFQMVNYSEHAAFIEDGTSKMAPRHPLQDAVDIMEKQMGTELDRVSSAIMEG